MVDPERAEAKRGKQTTLMIWLRVRVWPRRGLLPHFHSIIHAANPEEDFFLSWFIVQQQLVHVVRRLPHPHTNSTQPGQ
jgi:hypothetical protein